MGGIPIDDTTWKAILDETDTNKDGKVIIFLIFFHFFSRYQWMNLLNYYLEDLMSK